MKLNIPVFVSSLLLSGLALAGSDRDAKRPAMRFGGGRLGVEALPISKEVRQMLGAPEDAGVLVNRVESESAAAEAGVKAGDVIVEADGQKIKDVSALRGALADKEAGQTAQLQVIRDKKQTALTVKLRERPRRFMGAFDSFDHPEAFAWADGPFHDAHKDLEKLGERLAELEKRLQKLESTR